MANTRVAVVTGGASGIGKAIGQALTARGYSVAVADISAEGAAETAAELGDAARGYSCDVTQFASLERLAADVARDLGDVNLVFANAGVAIGGKLHETDAAEFAWLFDVNVTGTFNTVRAFTDALSKTAAAGGEARLVFTGSENSVGLPTLGPMTAYTATKHAILAMADGARRDFEDSGVKVSIFCPGVVPTNISNARRRRQDRYGGAAPLADEHAEEAFAYMTKIGRSAEDTVRLCLEGIDRDDFLIITDPAIREYAETRQAKVNSALDRLDRSLASSGEAS